VNLFRLALAYLRARPLNTLLNIFLLALGVAMIVVLMLFTRQMEERLQRDLKGIDLVVGAKGSPMQLILSSVYHLDIPTGNILLKDAEELRKHPQIKAAIPLALGDSYRGFRIVGTEHAYPNFYGAKLASGALWTKPLEATLGAEVAQTAQLKVGDRFTGAHGLGEGGGEHEEAPYTVVGVLAPTGTVVDRLLLTGVESVWRVHEHHGAASSADGAAQVEGEKHDAHEARAGDEHKEHASHDEHKEHAEHAEHEEHEELKEHKERSAHGEKHEEQAALEHEHATPPNANQQREITASPKTSQQREITALLVQYKSSFAAVGLPRFINSKSALQAASPAMESARLFQLVGFGVDTLRAFAGILIFSAALSVFIALTNALQERRYDLAVLRTLGAAPGKLLRLILTEGILLALAGALFGLLLGHLATEVLGRWLTTARQVEITGLTWLPQELWLIALALGVGLLASIVPALSAYRTDIAATLAKE
jgi:putative ABC transport system permease protein